MYGFGHFSLRDMTDCSAALRKLGTGARTEEEVAARTVSYLYDSIREEKTGDRACVLVRLFRTHRLGELDPELANFAGAQLGGQPPHPQMKCLVLLGTAGVEPEWNRRELSASHRAIPLPSPEFVRQFPMIARLFSQFGLELQELFRPDPSLLMDMTQTSFNVFYVPEAVGSPYVPAQDSFVIRRAVSSVLGFGGLLPKGDLFAVIIFSRVHIPRTTAEMFKPLALSVKVALLSATGSRLLVR